MSTLSDDDRRALARAIERARGFAEEGAREALVQHTVGDAKPGAHLDEVGRRLRNKLRAHARQLGDQKCDDGTHAVERLVAECGYAHWHRMLFARFLAENSLLWHPDGYPVSLEELEDWAKEWGLRSHWEAAERCAAQILPQIFGNNALVLSISLSARSQKLLEETLEGIPSAVFKARDSLGWVYQFWQLAEKERINKSEVKIGADELSAVTQLFTEPYMVDFLLQNTLGAWWVGRHGHDDLPVEMPYLRLLGDGAPAAGTFDEWPKTTRELTVLDPCCGSGHFLVAAFDLLVRFRVREENLLPRVAAELVIRDNLHGLELDRRCTQIAAFSLAFAAWTFPGVEQYFQLPELHIACVGLGIQAELSDWLALANGNTKFRAGMTRLFMQFKNAPVLGSLIDPTVSKDPLLEASFDELRPLLNEALMSEKWSASDDASEMGSVAQGIAKAATLLAGRYTLVCTNPPYLTSGKQSDLLRKFCLEFCLDGSADLATVFMKRCRTFCEDGGCYATVTPLNWLFLGSYHNFRMDLLKHQVFALSARLGSGATATASWDVLRALTIITNLHPTIDYQISGLETDSPTEAGRSLCLAQGQITESNQSTLLANPDSRIAFGNLLAGDLLSTYAGSYQGLKSGDDARFRRLFWEPARLAGRWRKLQSTVESTRPFGGLESAIDWGVDGEELARKQGFGAWGKLGVAVTQMRALPCSLYLGEIFDSNIGPVVPKNIDALPALWAFCESGEYQKAVRRIDQKMAVANATLVKVPFDLAHWTSVAKEKYPEGLPAPHSNDPTQWLFRGDIPSSTRPLQVAIAQLAGYRWPAQPSNPTLDAFTDNDGIVCLPAIRQEKPAASRLLDLLVAAYNTRWTTDTLPELLAREGASGMTLETWLRDRFFDAHCSLFHQRPFVWQVWDGLKDGFSALLHYHRLTHATMKTLIYTDLGDWIDRQEAGVKGGAVGAEQRLIAAKTLRAKLETILVGEKPHDIFVRWKSLDAQPLGWEPDLDDGVRLNIRPFLTANVLVSTKSIKGIDWHKDRGKESSASPWYGRFGGERINDHHTTLAEKQAARAAKNGRGRS